MIPQFCHTYRKGDLRIFTWLTLLGRFEVFNFDFFFANPISVGLFFCIAHANFFVPMDAISLSVYLDHLARAQASCHQNIGGINLDRSNFARQYETIVARNVITSRTKTVAVKRCTKGAAIGIGNSRRSIPRLHNHGLILVISTTALRQSSILVPWLRQQHRDRASHVTTIHNEKFQHVI